MNTVKPTHALSGANTAFTIIQQYFIFLYSILKHIQENLEHTVLTPSTKE